jgi:ABC-2 type transport system ATP-binding protein
MLVANNLSKKFGSLTAVNDLSLTVEKGEIVGFLGSNGAGKTTTIKMLAGALLPDSGQVKIAGTDFFENWTQARNKLGYLPEGAPLYSGLTPRQSLKFILGNQNWAKPDINERLAVILSDTHLLAQADSKISQLSKGYQRRTALAIALALNPEVLLLDEPFDGFDPIQKKTARKLLRKLAKNKAILICSHSLSETQALCDRVLVLYEGQLIASGTIREIIAQTGGSSFDDAFHKLLEQQT